MKQFFHESGVPSYCLGSPVPVPTYLRFQERARLKRTESLLFLEHNPSLTQGTQAKPKNLLVSPSILLEKGISVYEIGRGGDFTAHEPGQIVGYFHIDLRKRNWSLGDYLKTLTQALLSVLTTGLGIPTIENPKSPGLYLAKAPEKKILSMGILAKSYFTSFGFALNYTNDCSTFGYIHPCGGLSQNMVSASAFLSKEELEGKRLGICRELSQHFLDRLPKEKEK